MGESIFGILFRDGLIIAKDIGTNNMQPLMMWLKFVEPL